MAIVQYPVFVKGQTLTDDDLNELRDWLDGKDRRLGRLIGFGIDCGLAGAINGPALQIDTGLAIDQVGQALELEAVATLELPPKVSTDEPPAFLDPAPGGFTPVLTLRTEEVPAVQCNEAGCEGHASERKQTTILTTYPGRLRDAIVDFGDEPLLQQEPVLVRKNGNVSGAFKGLRDAIVARLGDRLNADAKTKLATMAIDADLDAIKGFKAGFLNQVFFAALDLLRCELETSATCVTTADGIGVALGWLHQTGTTWAWDCEYRHDWQVPSGVAMAILGGRCDDPCGLYRDQVNALINAFEVPVTPAPPDHPDPKPPKLCYEKPYRTASGKVIYSNCVVVQTPPQTIDPDWKKYFKEKVTFPPIPPVLRADDVYRVPPRDWAEAGTITLTDGIGKESTNVLTEVTNILTAQGNGAPVQVVGRDAAAKLPGFNPSVVVSAADTVVLVEDDQHKVVGVGSIPANTTIRDAVAEVPHATATAERADRAAASALETAGTLTNRLGAVDTQMASFAGFQKEMVSWQAGIDGRIGGLGAEIGGITSAAIGEFQLKLGTQIEDRIAAGVNALRGGLLDQVRAEIDAIGGTIRADVAHDLDAATTKLRTDFEAGQQDLGGKIGVLDQQLVGLDRDVKVATRDADRSNTRIDAVLTKPQISGGRVGEVSLDRNVVSVISSMRSSILAAATNAQKPAVTAALAESDDALKTITDATAGGPVSIEEHREALNTVLTSMTTAVEAAGAPAADVARLRRDIPGAINR